MRRMTLASMRASDTYSPSATRSPSEGVGAMSRHDTRAPSGLAVDEVPHEEVCAPPPAVRALAGAVAAAWDDEQLEVLVRLDERVHDLHRRGRAHVVIVLAPHEQELARQQVRVRHVRALDLAVVHRPAHPLLVPPD